MRSLGRGFYCKLSPLMITQADDMARERCPDVTDAMDEGLVKETVRCRCERAARIFVPPLDFIKVMSGLHEPKVSEDKYYLFIEAAHDPYFLVLGWLRGSEMVGRKIASALLHKPYTLFAAIKAERNKA